MENPASKIDDFIRHIDGCMTNYDLFRLVKKLVVAFSFTHFVLFDIPKDTALYSNMAGNPLKIRDVAHICNWPPELLAAYDDNGLFTSSEMLLHAKRDSRPLIFDVYQASFSQDAELAAQLFKRFGLSSGVSFSAHEPNGTVGVLCLIGENLQVDTAHLAALQYFFNLVYNRLHELKRNNNSQASIKVPKRELDCLEWTALGKTSYEIAVILDLSENTVSGYLASATKRLNAQNRAHAVAVAIRMGIIG